MPATRSHSQKTSVETGFTLIELVITMALLLLVVGTLTTVFISIQRTQAFTQDRSQSLDDMRIAIDRLTKEARQAIVVNGTSTASRLDMQTYVNGVATAVVYEVDSGGTKVLRTVGGHSATILTNLNSTALFTYTPDVAGAQVIRVELSVHPARRPDTVLQLTSEIRLRNEGKL